MKDVNQKPFYKRWWFVLIVVLFIFAGIGGILDSAGVQTDKEKEIETTKMEEEKAKKEENERKKNRTTVEVIDEDYDKVDDVSLKDGLLTLETNPGTVWSENSLFHAVYDLFEVMHEAFEDNSIDEIEAEIQIMMVDSKGNESDESVITYVYTRDSFKELNYDKFSEMAFGQQWRILNEADGYFIHPGIYKNLKDKYTDNLSHDKSKVRSYE